MARYISSFVANTTLKQVPLLLNQLLEACNFEVVYQTADYVMGREIPGQVVFSKLVTVEVLIESNRATENQVPATFVVKNDELPLNPNNHCQQCFQRIQQVLNESKQWVLGTAVTN